MKTTRESTRLLSHIMICAGIALATSLMATPAQFNGHVYDVVLDRSASWTQANAAATARGGYLVTITSQAEQTFVQSLLSASGVPSGGYWIGLTAPSVTRNFGWANGDALSYTHWGYGEPNNGIDASKWGDETSGQMLWTSDADSGLADYSARGGWNDIRNLGWSAADNPDPWVYDLVRTGYIIELVPEPASGLLILLGSGLFLIRRKVTGRRSW